MIFFFLFIFELLFCEFKYLLVCIHFCFCWDYWIYSYLFNQTFFLYWFSWSKYRNSDNFLVLCSGLGKLGQFWQFILCICLNSSTHLTSHSLWQIFAEDGLILSSHHLNTWPVISPGRHVFLMSEDSSSKPFHFQILEGQDEAPGCRASTSCSSMPRGAAGCSSMAQLHRMGGYNQGGPELGLPSDGSDSSGQERPATSHSHRKNARSRSLPEEDVEMKSSGSSGSGTESHGNESHGNESHGNESNGHESMGSSNSNSKDSALLESSGSNKR